MVKDLKKNQYLKIKPSLKAATRKTSKGEYHKIQHASKLLALLNVDKVRAAAPHCDRIFKVINKIISG